MVTATFGNSQLLDLVYYDCVIVPMPYRVSFIGGRWGVLSLE